MIGLSLDAAIEGKPHGIIVNAVMPTAYSRMIEQIPDADAVAWFRDNLPPEKVAEAMTWFLSPLCDVSGRILLTGGGRFAAMVMAETEGFFDPDINTDKVGQQITTMFDESGLTVTHDHQQAGASYFRFFPWTAGASVDFGPDRD